MNLQSFLAGVAVACLACGCAAEEPSPASHDTGTAIDAAGSADSVVPIDTAAPADIGVPADAVDTADAAAVPLSLAPTELLAALPNRDFLLINLVIPAKQLIDGTDLSVAATDTASQEKALGFSKSTKVVFYCMSGKSSKMVMAKLNALGYLNLRDLAGGMMAWQAAGLPVKKP